jgi:hypothetical protein
MPQRPYPAEFWREAVSLVSLTLPKGPQRATAGVRSLAPTPGGR